MIPILYEKGETQFTTNGLGRLANAISCTVSEEINGEYELEMEYPVYGIHYRDITYGRLIYAQPSVDTAPQPFEIYLITRPMNMRVKIKAEHISYRMKYIPVTLFSASTLKNALTGLKSHAVCNCPFTLDTDKDVTGDFEVEQPDSMRSFLADGDNTIATIFGGEWEFDKFSAHLWRNRGVDNGVTIRYGKNLTSLEQEENIENMVTAIYPYWTGNDEYVDLPEKIVHTGAEKLFPYERVVAVDFGDSIEGETTRTWTEVTTVEESHEAQVYVIDPSTSRGHYETQTIKTPVDKVEEKTETIKISPDAESIRKQAQIYISQNQLNKPKVSLKVGFNDLRRASENADISAIETVHLGDIVTVQFIKLGVSSKAEITKTEYDVLNERYNSIDVGDQKPTLNDVMTRKTTIATVNIPRMIDDARKNESSIKELERQAKYNKTGSKTLTLENSTDAVLMTMAELDTLFGMAEGTCNNENTVISAVNADQTITTPITGCVYNSEAWHVIFASLVNGSVLVNYTVRYIGG